MRPARLLLGLVLASCGPRVPPPPPLPPREGEGRPPATAVARVAQGWVLHAAGADDLARARAEAATRLDPHHGEPKRLLAEITGDEALWGAVGEDDACAPCQAGIARRRPAAEADATWAAAVRAGLPGERLVAEAPWPPGPQTLAAWRARPPRAPTDAAWRAVAVALLDPDAPLGIELSAGPPEPRALRALAEAGRRGTALQAARAAGRSHPHDPRVLRTWRALAADAGHRPDEDAALAALLALPVAVLAPGDPDVRAAARVLATGSLPAGVSVEEAALWVARHASDAEAGRGFTALPAPTSAGDRYGELQAWLAAARRVGADEAARAVVQAAGGDRAPDARARVLAGHLVASGHLDAAAAQAGGAASAPAWWPVLLSAARDARGDPAGLEDVLRTLPEQVARATASPDTAWARLQAGDVDGACAALSAPTGPVPGAGPVGYACARRGVDAAALLRQWEHAPADGLLVLARALSALDAGDLEEAAALGAEARRLLPGGSGLTPDLDLLRDAAWRAHPLMPSEAR